MVITAEAPAHFTALLLALFVTTLWAASTQTAAAKAALWTTSPTFNPGDELR